MSIKKDVKETGRNLVGAGSETISLGAEFISFSAGLLHNGLKALPSVGTALLTLPKSTAVGYVAEDRDISLEEAKDRVEESMPDSIAEAIEQTGIATGKSLASLKSWLEEEDED